MLDYPALAALAEIIRRGSFDAAAAALGVTPSAVSQRIRNLEERAGAALIDRGPPVAPTEAGARLAAHLENVRLMEAMIEGDAAPHIRIALNADSLASWAMPALQAAPGLLDIVIDDQDHAVDWLRRGLVVAAITTTGRPLPGCNAVFLGQMRYRATASPDFVARHFDTGIHASAMTLAPSLSFNTKDMLQEQWARRKLGCAVTLPLVRIPSSEAFAEATRRGMGWGMNPDALVADDLENGVLVDLDPDLPVDVPLYWQANRMMSDALRPLEDAMKKAAREALLP
ncbi:LysR family transcriptional regulator ArgP [Paracoccus sp. 1_MG-2023]|uniref:LysR family transcriptional regulator ArgP n=1 Tax=unclassified Paracoccus (in: a-proteobacteria) TaxID=2688777 RepID=UPI001C0A5774|nr:MULTISPECIES: LysR family transcriptional regulator ArgP [unclassified Paracoccus (in: a-proteobacteria)]MBU2956599.1 LysR family transcriptional regulator ArgP [Paracoccus sp. C2R09]MDO6668705.1 LysR family transcriptional regulator ArgP [Paracoccus sp. 1_MG-2023]